MLNRINELINGNDNFAFETTLATKSYRSKIIAAQAKNYKVTLLFFWLQTVDLAIERVKTRVQEGGHNIENNIIKRRYTRGIKNLFEIYLPIVDETLIFDNSNKNHILIASKTINTDIKVFNKQTFINLKTSYNE